MVPLFCWQLAVIFGEPAQYFGNKEECFFALAVIPV
jgi:hypothetical protein